VIGFVDALKSALEVTPGLRNGEAFLPIHLKGWRLSRYLFSPVADALASKIGWQVIREKRVTFPPVYEVWTGMRVDYAFSDARSRRPHIYLELETLDRAQLYNFLPRPDEEDDESKLWHYYGLLAKHLQGIELAPKALLFVMVLPDEPVDRYQLWDTARDVGLFRSELAPLIYQSPFRFFDPLIKSAARLFLRRLESFPTRLGGWESHRIADLQHVCELVFVTLTRKVMVVSRGRDGFAPNAERRYPLTWVN